MRLSMKRLSAHTALLSAASIFVSAAALQGCAEVPRAGPAASEIVDQAATPDGQRYVLVNVDSKVAGMVGRREPTSFAAKFGDYRPSHDLRIGVGDGLVVTIWEAGPGGLFSAPLLPGGTVSAGSNSATIPEQLVGRDGAITVPYAGRIHVAGQTTQAVQATVEKALQGKAIQPQALVNVSRPISNTVTVGGEVVQGARVPLTLKGDRLLDVIAAAGGVRAPVHESFVELTRGGHTMRVSLTRVVNDPHENIYVSPGDTITVVHDPQTYMILGAAGHDAQIPFQSDGATLAEALTNAGGLNDNQADPTGVFVFRYEPVSVVKQLRPDWVPPAGAQSFPVVYRLDLSAAESLLLAQRFAILNRDVVYVSNAPATQIEKVLTLTGSIFSAANNAATGAYYVKTLTGH